MGGCPHDRESHLERALDYFLAFRTGLEATEIDVAMRSEVIELSRRLKCYGEETGSCVSESL